MALCLVSVARADTIVLTNGRRIVAAGIVHENGKVTFDTQEGQLSLPESMVARVEKDSAGLVSAAPNPRAATVKIARPERGMTGGDGRAAALVVHDGGIDRQALAQLDAAAAEGGAEAIASAAAGESAAGRFAFDSGDLQQAMVHANRAVALAPSQVPLLLDVAYLHLQLSEAPAAIDTLDRARRLDPDSPDVAKLAGWADYLLNRLPQAVAEWKRAQELRPEPEVAQALEKAEHDLAVEGNFREGQSAHFDLRYYGGAAPELARDILPLLESDFQSTASLLAYTPSEPIAVVLYTKEVFSDVTRAPKWANALNDGRIRVPVQGLEAVTPELARVLKHELAHSFISQKTRGRAPVWVQEGVAQWIEGSRVGGTAAATLLSLYDRHQDPALSVLEGSWLSSGNDFAGIAYAWSLATIEGVVANGGPGDVERLLDGITTEPATEAAVRSVLRLDYNDLNRATAEYLRRAYLH